MNDNNLCFNLLKNGSTLAKEWLLQGQWRDAFTLVHGLLPVALRQDEKAIAEHYLLQGHILLDEAMFGGQDTLDAGQEALNQALDHANKAGDVALKGAIWDAKGSALHTAYLATDRSKEFEDELLFFERGLAFHKDAADPRGIAASLFHIGMVHGIVRQDHVRALPYFEEAYALAKEAGDIVMASYAIRHIGFAHHDAGKGDVAYAAIAESLALREEAGWVPGIAMALHVMAYAETEYGDKAKAIPCLERACEIFESLGVTKRVGWMTAEIEQFAQR